MADENVVLQVDEFHWGAEAIRKLQAVAERAYSIPIFTRKFHAKGTLYYVYPRQWFENMRSEFKLDFSSLKNVERKSRIKALLDGYISGELDIPLLHLGLWSADPLFADRYDDPDGFYTEKSLGKRRYEVYQTIPRCEVILNEEYFMEIWSSLMDKRFDEYRYPNLKHVRLFVQPQLFGHYTGWGFHDEEGWIEPVSGKEDRYMQKWLDVGQALVKQDRVSEYVEGYLRFEEHSGEQKYYLGDYPLPRGSKIEICFGGIWIPGRFYTRSLTPTAYLQNGDDQIRIDDTGLKIRMKK